MSEQDRLRSMLKKIEDIEYFISGVDGQIVRALSDRTLKPAIRMQLIVLSEDFTRLTQEGAFEILAHFNRDDIKGLNAVRNFIAHDYDSVDDDILEIVIRKHLPLIKNDLQAAMKA
ncbi:MAG: HepT-like ribonuclease domain-containing protein [Campylobacterota bacterium]